MRMSWASTAYLVMLGAGCSSSGGTFTTVSIDPAQTFPIEAAGIEIVSVHVREMGKLRVGQAELRNPGGHTVVWVTANWYDVEGVYVDDPKETQREVLLAPHEEKSLTFTAPHPGARHLRIQIRRGSKRPR